MFLAQALYVSVDGALDFFYLAEPDCLPGGPAFSFSYYVTWANVVGSVFSILGVALFQVSRASRLSPVPLYLHTRLCLLVHVFAIVFVPAHDVGLGFQACVLGHYREPAPYATCLLWRERPFGLCCRFSLSLSVSRPDIPELLKSLSTGVGSMCCNVWYAYS